MQDYHINIFYSEEDGGYIADIPDLEACSAFGDTPAKALQELQKAKNLAANRPGAGETDPSAEISASHLSGGFKTLNTSG